MRAFVLAFFLVMMFQTPVAAHRVNIFASVEGSDVLVECAFSTSSPVRKGRIDVFDAVSGEELLHGETDDKGFFRFPVPEKARAAGSGLRIRVYAGEGHQNEWTVEAEELRGTIPAQAAAPAEEFPTTRTLGGPLSSGLTRSEVEAVVNAALDSKLAPIKRAVLEKSGPGVTEIIGGIGWIFGLAGVASYFRSRPRVR